MPVVLPSAGVDLTTLANVRAFLGKSSTDASQDATISALITRVSTALQRYAGREFAPVSSNISRVFLWEGGPVWFAPYDCTAVTAVQLDDTSTTPTNLLSTAGRRNV